jgi:hypothetical protein
VLEHTWPVPRDPSQISGHPALLYFKDVPEDFTVEIHLPEVGANGFEPSTYFFDFVWDAPNKAVRMVKKSDAHVNQFNYKFCYAPEGADTSACPPGFVVIATASSVTQYVKPIAKQLRFAILQSFDLTPVFNYFTNTSIDVNVFSPHPIARPDLIVPVAFLYGNKFGETRLANLTLKFDHIQNPPIPLSDVIHLELHNVSIDTSVLQSLAPHGCDGTPRLAADPYSYHALQDRCIPDVLYLDETQFDHITFSNDKLHLTSAGVSAIDITLQNRRPALVEMLCHQHALSLSVAPGTTQIPRTNIFQPDTPDPLYTFDANWTPLLAGNLTIDNLGGTVIVNTPFVPFRPGFFFGGPEGAAIRITAADGLNVPDGIRVIYPFPDHVHVTTGNVALRLRYEDVSLVEPVSLYGDVERAVFAGVVNFSLGAGINVRDATFDPHKRPTINIEFRLQGGLPRIYLGTNSAPADLPAVVNLVHRGASEKTFIQRHPDWFRQFSHEILCASEELPCRQWHVDFLHNASEDATRDHVSGSSILKTECRQENEGVRRTCLVIEIDEFYFPYASQTRLATRTRSRSPVPTHTPVATHTPVKSRSHVTDGAGGGSAKAGGGSMGAGVALGVAIGVLVMAIVGILLWLFVLKPKVERHGYEDADLDARLGVSL